MQNVDQKMLFLCSRLSIMQKFVLFFFFSSVTKCFLAPQREKTHFSLVLRVKFFDFLIFLDTSKKNGTELDRRNLLFNVLFWGVPGFRLPPLLRFCLRLRLRGQWGRNHHLEKWCRKTAQKGRKDLVHFAHFSPHNGVPRTPVVPAKLRVSVWKQEKNQSKYLVLFAPVVRDG